MLHACEYKTAKVARLSAEDAVCDGQPHGATVTVDEGFVGEQPALEYFTADGTPLDGPPSEPGAYKVTMSCAGKSVSRTFKIVKSVVTLMPGQGSKAYETREEAEAAAAATEVLPAEGFGLTGDALATWQGYFVNRVFADGDGNYRFVPELDADGSNALAQAEAKLTKAIDVSAIAAATGAIEEMVLTGAEPGFYYTLFKSTDVTTVLEQENHDPDNCDCKALSDGKVTFKNVTKPSAAVGFFAVRAFVKESFTNPFGG